MRVSYLSERYVVNEFACLIQKLKCRTEMTFTGPNEVPTEYEAVHQVICGTNGQLKKSAQLANCCPVIVGS